MFLLVLEFIKYLCELFGLLSDYHNKLDEDDSSKEDGDGSESEHQVFGRFHSGCSGGFLELPELLEYLALAAGIQVSE